MSKWKKELGDIIDGIDREETDPGGGWFETSTGAEFGAKKKQEIEDFVEANFVPVSEIEIMAFICTHMKNKYKTCRYCEGRRSAVKDVLQKFRRN